MTEYDTLGFVRDKHGDTSPIETTMRFDPKYPLEVRFQFEDHGAVEWIFARDLLVVGAVKAAGTGDVRIEPTKNEMVLVTLDSPSGHGEIEFSLVDVLEFLNQASREAPEDEEGAVSAALDAFFTKEFG